MTELRDAAQAVVDRWDTPLWKDAGPTAYVINRLRDALAEAAFGAVHHSGDLTDMIPKQDDGGRNG